MEIWKDIKNYEGYYKVSNFGRILSLQKRGGKSTDAIRVLCNGQRYKHINLAKDGKVSTKTVHVLVAEAFLDYNSKNEFGLVVDHINNNPHDNNLSNLQIITARENLTKDKSSPSGYRGVCWHKPLSKWRAQISIEGKKYHLGYFDCPIEASNVYNLKLQEL